MNDEYYLSVSYDTHLINVFDIVILIRCGAPCAFVVTVVRQSLDAASCLLLFRRLQLFGTTTNLSQIIWHVIINNQLLNQRDSHTAPNNSYILTHTPRGIHTQRKQISSESNLCTLTIFIYDILPFGRSTPLYRVHYLHI